MAPTPAPTPAPNPARASSPSRPPPPPASDAPRAPLRHLTSLHASPSDLLAAWPAHDPLAVLWSGGPPHLARWTVLARPARAQPLDPAHFLPHIDRPSAHFPAQPPDPNLPPFSSGWIGALSYHLGAALEPRASGRHTSPTPSLPLATWLRVDQALIHDRLTNTWFSSGGLTPPPLAPAAPRPAFCLGPLRSDTGRDAYEHAVARALEYIRAGDVYQVNLAHTLRATFQGSPRALFSALTASAAPRFGAYLEFTHDGTLHALASASPEMFLSFDPHTRRVECRPMKGTRPVSAGPAALRDSVKDRAELDMIIDLMRNDLGRVCGFGSVRVDRPRDIETHADSVLQATALVSGTLRDSRSLADLLTATFPCGSITGAPKIRAMQIIEELEPAPRNFYCGSLGYLSDTGHAAFNVAIRTAHITFSPRTSSASSEEADVPLSTPEFPDLAPEGRRFVATGGAEAREAGLAQPVENTPESLPPRRGGGTPLTQQGARLLESPGTLTYSVGAGIVADSTPAEEWQETLVKAGILGPLAPMPENTA